MLRGSVGKVLETFYYITKLLTWRRLIPGSHQVGADWHTDPPNGITDSPSPGSICSPKQTSIVIVD